MRKSMLAFVLAASLTSAAHAQTVLPPCCTNVHSSPARVSNASVADCMPDALAHNHLTVHDARRMQIGQRIAIYDVSMTVASGDTIWGLCRLRLQQLQEAMAASEKLMDDLDKLNAEFAQMQRIYKSLPHDSRTSMWISAAALWLITLGNYPRTSP